jgi:hypothetical protein
LLKIGKYRSIRLFIYIDKRGLIGFWGGYAGSLRMGDYFSGGINAFSIFEVGWAG